MATKLQIGDAVTTVSDVKINEGSVNLKYYDNIAALQAAGKISEAPGLEDEHIVDLQIGDVICIYNDDIFLTYGEDNSIKINLKEHDILSIDGLVDREGWSDSFLSVEYEYGNTGYYYVMFIGQQAATNYGAVITRDALGVHVYASNFEL